MTWPAAPMAERHRLATLLAAQLGPCAEIDFALGHGSCFAGLAFRDVDVALWLATPADDLRLSRIAVDCSRSAGLPVDLTVLNSAGEGFRRAAAQGYVIFARDPERAQAFVERHRLDAWDFAAMARQSAHDLLRR